MGLVEVQMKILEKLWEDQQPMRAKGVAKELNLRVAAATLHLLRLKKLGYVHIPKHGYYAITNLGKETIGLPKIDKVNAAKILSTVPYDSAFHFCTSIHQYTHVLANSLLDFGEKLQKIDVKSVEFHVPRKDFEQWFQSIGDVELAKRLGIIRGMHFHGQELRTKVYETVKHRLEELKHIHG